MVAYTEIPEANALYDEQARINSGIALVDAGGIVVSFTIAPPEAPLGEVVATPITITTVSPGASLMAEVRVRMVARNNAISAELAALGYTGTPLAVV